MNGDLYKRMLDSSIDAIVSVDGTGAFIFWNRAAEAMFGHTKDEMLGSPVLTIIPPDMHAKHRAGFARFLKTAAPVLVGKTVEVPALRKDGAVIPVELSLFADKGEGGWTFTAIIRDITLRKKAEDAIMSQNVELAGVNTELSALFAVSSSLSHPLEFENLLAHALKVVTGVEALNIEKK